MIIQFCGMSGAGKTTIAEGAKASLALLKIPIEIIDGDVYRKLISKDLGFSKADRMENIRRLAFVSEKFASQNIIPIICAINPYEEIRAEIKNQYEDVKTVFINCPLHELIKRDTKGLYKRALLPDDHIDKIKNLTGISDPFEIPKNADLVIDTNTESVNESVKKLISFIQKNK
jgi:adenylylsulfate kinase